MAPTLSKLAETDQLYEGNFEQWRKRVSSIFMVKRRPRQLSATRLYDPTIGGTIDAAVTHDELEIFRRRISPALLLRLPDELWSPGTSLGALYAELKRFCQPFRLSDLPAELRVKIFEQIVDENAVINRDDNKAWTIISSHRLPALAQSNQRLRQEVLPIYFSTTTFTVTIDVDAFEEYLGRGYCATLRNLALSWSRNFVRTSARHLRHIKLDLTVLSVGERGDMEWPSITLELLFSKDKGYRIEYTDTLSRRSKEELGKHVRFLNGERSDSGINGETILIALGEECHTWDYTNLCLGEEADAIIGRR